MRAAVVHAFDGPPSYGAFEEPRLAPGEIVVEVAAAALSPLARIQASGKHYSSQAALPFVPGVDGVGRLADGRRVYFAFPARPWGALAERVAVRSEYTVPVPPGLDDVTAAAIANPGMSSWVALKSRARLQAGEGVLVNGATGTSGRLAVRIARHLGAGRVVVTGRNEARLAELAAEGADAVISLNGPADELVRAFRRGARRRRGPGRARLSVGPAG